MSTEGTEIYAGLLRDNEALRAELAASNALSADRLRKVQELLAEQEVWRAEIVELRRKDLLAR